jgi:hypothetical protein
MRLIQLAFAALLPFAAATVQAGDLSPEIQAKFIKVIVSSSSIGKIACTEPALKAALEAQGVVVDSSSMIVWVTNPNEAKMLKAAGRLVIGGSRNLLALACVVLEEEGGRPKLLLNTANLKASRVQLSDAVMKIGEKL